MPNIEQSFNFSLARVLRKKSRRWDVEAEQKGADFFPIPHKNKQADVVVRGKGGGPIVLIESEFAPAGTVEADASARLTQLTETAAAPKCEQVVALRVPAEFKRKVPEAELADSIRKESGFEYCLFSPEAEPGQGFRRFPQKGWIKGSVDDLADLLESCLLSEKLLGKTLRVLEEGVGKSADLLHRRILGRCGWPGIVPDLRQAAEWYRLAAENGHPTAGINLQMLRAAHMEMDAVLGCRRCVGMRNAQDSA